MSLLLKLPLLLVKKSNTLSFRKIADRLKGNLASDEETASRHHEEYPSMSLAEKMSRWLSRSDVNPPRPEPSDIFEGVQDIEDEIEFRELSEYVGLIMRSPAYTWLVTSLARESNHRWSTVEQRVMITDIREKILQSYHLGSISRGSSLPMCSAVFKMPRRPLESRIKGGGGSERPKELINLGVWTCSSLNEIQSSTVEQYFTQTWGSKEVAQVVLEHIRLPDMAFHHEIPQGREAQRIPVPDGSIALSSDGNDLVVNGYGHSYFISSLGEQLSWICAAIRPTPYPGRLSAFTPFLVRDNTCTFYIHCKEEVISYPISANFQAVNSSTTVIAKGFPILCRPSTFLGVEMSFLGLVGQLGRLDEPLHRTIDGRIILRGPSGTIELCQATGSVLYWHRLGYQTQICSCRLRFEVKSDTTVSRSLDTASLTKFRHILEDCKTAGFQTGGENDDETKSSDQNQRSSETTSIIAGLGVTDRPRVHNSTKYTDSPHDSFDSDLLSISDRSSSMEPLVLDHEDALFPIIDQVTLRLLSELRNPPFSIASKLSESAKTLCRVPSIRDTNLRERPSETGSASRRTAVAESTAASSSSNTTSQRPRRLAKRALPERNDDDEENDDRKKRTRLEKAASGDHSPVKYLACPFFKRDPTRHSRCVKYELIEIKHVKQHLKRRHRILYCCQRCKASFKDQTSLNSHISGMCDLSHDTEVDGITLIQDVELSKKYNDATIEARWLRIWRVIFGSCTTPPSSIYIDLGLSEEVRLFQEHLANRGPQVLVEELQERGIELSEQLSAVLPSAYSLGLTRIIQEFQARHSAFSMLPALDSSTTSKLPKTNSTPLSSNPDSGVVVKNTSLGSAALVETGSFDDLAAGQSLPWLGPTADVEELSNAPGHCISSKSINKVSDLLASQNYSYDFETASDPAPLPDYGLLDDEFYGVFGDMTDEVDFPLLGDNE